MITSHRAGTARILCAAIGLFLTLADTGPGEAASWQWSAQGGRERVEIHFDAPLKDQTATRTGTTRLAVKLGGPAENFGGKGQGKLVVGVSPQGDTLELNLRDPAFGYVVSKPDARTLRVDVFADALGARWKGPDTAPAISATATSAPAAPTTRSPQSPQAAQAQQAPQPSNTTQAPVTNTGTAKRADPRTEGRVAMSDGRNAMPTSGARATAQQPVASRTPQVSQAPQVSQSSREYSNPLYAVQTAIPPIKPVDDPSLPTTAVLSDITSRLEAMGVGESQTGFVPSALAADIPEGGTVRGRMNRSDQATPDRINSAPVAPASAVSAPTQAAPVVPAPVVPAPVAPAPVSSTGVVRQRLTQASPPTTPSVTVPGQPSPAQQTLQPVAQPAAQARPVQGQSVTGSMIRQPMNQSGQAQSGQAQSGGTQQNTTSRAASSPAASPTPPNQVPQPQTTQQQTAQQQPTQATQPRTAQSDSRPANGSVVEPLDTPIAPPPVQDNTLYVLPTDSGKARNLLENVGTPKKDAAGKEKQVIYVDEHGNVVDKPPDIPELLATAKRSMTDMQYATAKEQLLALKDLTLSPETREEVLYLISEADNNLFRDNPLAGYETITKSTSEAMNFNLDSERVPEALYRLGMLNLHSGNQNDAAGYFGALRTRYPQHELVPFAYYGLGEDQLKNKQYADAVRSFQLVMTEYPESRSIRDSARGMAEALYRQGHYDRAQILVDFVDRRWPRIYLDDPTYLPMVGEIQTRMQNYDNALQTYWTSYNLTPDNPINHRILLQIGAIYLQSGMVEGAREVLNELLRKFPKSESAPKAVLLMAEQGFLGENPTLDEMFTMFGKPGDMPVEVAYRRILKDYPDSPEAKLINIRDIALTYWNGDTAEAMDKAQAYMREHPDAPGFTRAQEVLQRGFARDLEMARQEGNNDRILTLWERFPEVHPQYDPLGDDMRVAMARAKLNRGDEPAGLADLAPFLDKPQGPYSDYVYNLFLAKDLRDNNWNAILDLGNKVDKWTMPPDVRNQLDYSMAISAENLGLKDKSTPIWRKLYNLPDDAVPPYQKAYATYFMARDAENRRDLKDAYDLNLETLKRFNALAEERSDKADPERVRESLAGLMDVTEVAGRFAEALDWTENYAAFVPQDSQDYAGLLFRQARLHRKMGDMARWRNLLDTIVKREPESVFGRMAASELRTQEVSRDLSRFTAPPGLSATASAAANGNGPNPQNVPAAGPAGGNAGNAPATTPAPTATPAPATAPTPTAPTGTPAPATAQAPAAPVAPGQ